LLRPRVYVSRGLLSALSPQEVEAVLRHEAHHLRRRDPLRLFFLGLAQRLAAPFPAARVLIDRARVEIELAADRAALQAVPVEVLASALIKVASARSAVSALASAAGLTPDQARVAALLGRPVAIQLDVRDALVTVLVLMIVGAVIGHLASQPFLMSPICNACPSF
jgi:Zn-dependent protease with chaperone function